VAPTLSIVIATRDAARTLGQQVAAVAQQDLGEPWELIVVDNGSTDGTIGLLAEWADRVPSMRVISCTAPGINHARNAGVRAATSDRVLFCDADDVVAVDWARALATALADWDLVGGITTTTTLNDHRIQQSRPNPVSDHLRNAFGYLPYAVGANMGFRRGVFDAIGGFDVAFRLGADEIDFCWRAQYAGFRLGFVPEAVVEYRLRSRLREILRQGYQFARADAQLYAKHQGLGRLPRRSTLMQVRTLVRRLGAMARLDRVIRPQGRLRYARSLARVAGTVAGFVRYRVIV
jgi:glycosyltransferase involved in cell wall biosynthesis